MLIALAVFVSILAIIVGSYWAFIVRTERRARHDVQARLKTRRTKVAGLDIVKAEERMSSVWLINFLLSRWQRAGEPIAAMIERSGLKVTLGTIVLASVFVAALAMVLAMNFAPVNGFASRAAIALAAGVFGACAPFLYVRRAARRRTEKFEELFPEAVDLMSRSLRAGHALPSAIEMVGGEIPAPVGVEFKRLFDEQNFGLSLPDALRSFAQRVPILDARFFVTALLTQRETGGNLSEVLDKLAAVIRERFKVKRQVRVISAHGRITGWVLGFLPPAVAAALLIISPAHLRLLVDDPLGVYMVSTAIVLQVVGVLAIRRIVDVEY